jgi:hypothetical protein
MHAYDSPEGRANVAAIESKLKELDAVFRQFCSREGYTFSAMVDLWPRRRVWRRQEIDRCMDLTMTIGMVGVQDVLDRGFYPELPWSLSASGSLPPGTDPDIHILSRPVLEQVPFSQVASEGRRAGAAAPNLALHRMAARRSHLAIPASVAGRHR